MAEFPKEFVWGAATAAYQIEGGATEGGKGLSIWDVFSHTPGCTYRGETGDVACDSYHRWKEDLALLQSMHLKAYRFSVAWTRIAPNGGTDWNEEGFAYYDTLVDALLEAGIEPYVTLYHWDLPQALEEKGVHIVQGKATELIIENGVCKGVVTDRKKTYLADSTIVATGGASYPKTGSDGSGYRLCEKAGHTVMPLSPSLVPLTSSDKCCTELMGLSLKNVSVSFYRGEKELYHDFGEMLFTHFGVSGPIVLSASAYVKSFPTRMVIDLKPALDEKALDSRILSDFSAEKNRIFANSLSALLPRAMIPVIVKRSGIDPQKQVNAITKDERKRLVQLMHSFEINLNGTRPLDEAIITCGGVSVKEINPSTMGSKLVRGLYFAGEIIDVDAYTGGFNLQIAWATGKAAGEAAEEYLTEQ